jgi:hypothetical protein
VVKYKFVQTTNVPELTKIIRNSIQTYRNNFGSNASYGMNNRREYDSAVTPIVEVDGKEVNLILDIDGVRRRVVLVMDNSINDGWGYNPETEAFEIYNLPKKVNELKNEFWRNYHTKN